MSGKNLIFNTNVMSPVHGEFRAGDVGKNVDAAWGADLVAAGAARWGEGTKAEAAAAADAAGRISRNTKPAMSKTEHTFSTTDLAAQQKAGVVAGSPAADAANAKGATPAPASSTNNPAHAPQKAPPGSPGVDPGVKAQRTASAKAPAAQASKATRGAKATDATKTASGKSAAKTGAKSAKK